MKKSFQADCCGATCTKIPETFFLSLFIVLYFSSSWQKRAGAIAFHGHQEKQLLRTSKYAKMVVVIVRPDEAEKSSQSREKLRSSLMSKRRKVACQRAQFCHVLFLHNDVDHSLLRIFAASRTSKVPDWRRTIATYRSSDICAHTVIIAHDKVAHPSNLLKILPCFL